jgi:hypothetical protein
MNGHPNLTGSRCQCPACGEYFASVAAFDRHRVGAFAKEGRPNTRRCLAVAEMLEQEWPKTEKGFWLRPSAKAVHSDLGGPSSPPPATRTKGEPAWA